VPLQRLADQGSFEALDPRPQPNVVGGRDVDQRLVLALGDAGG
jgi:hypothetical protein